MQSLLKLGSYHASFIEYFFVDLIKDKQSKEKRHSYTPDHRSINKTIKARKDRLTRMTVPGECLGTISVGMFGELSRWS
jgi:hypothetical protein